MFTVRLLGIALAGLWLGACGLAAPRSDEGFADLDSLGVFDTDRKLALSVGPAILGFAARHVEGDPATEALLGGLSGVRVRIYEINGDGERVARKLNRMSDELQVEGWEPVVLVQDGGEQMHMLVKSRSDHILGMVVMASDRSEEVVLVNLMGNLPPELFSDVMLALEIDVPEVRLASLE